MQAFDTKTRGDEGRIPVLLVDSRPWPDFPDRFARATRIGWYALADGLLDEFMRAEGMDMAGVSAVKLYTDNVKWLLSSRLPQDFGDRLQVSGNAGGGAVININLPSKGGGVESTGGSATVTIDGHASRLDDK